ncbi:hypothetical protein [Parapedobacter tibetensis]|uniref:hypothetical protein n=1 Tax=Parapedobacter tibetensis TaxID=2972951 RepID=UPI00214D67EE|nr:hypothetical protein [Parapedobacter tibetensis]
MIERYIFLQTIQNVLPHITSQKRKAECEDLIKDISINCRARSSNENPRAEYYKAVLFDLLYENYYTIDKLNFVEKVFSWADKEQFITQKTNSENGTAEYIDNLTGDCGIGHGLAGMGLALIQLAGTNDRFLEKSIR